jgi:anaerobic ribonucleoside-triphosphate reductase
MIRVKKREGNLEEFSQEKIRQAILKAFKSKNYVISNNIENIAYDIAASVKVWNNISIEEIQDQIEELLMDTDYYDVAKSYILYRKEREDLRSHATKDIEFINNFINSNNAANATIDDNSNVGTKGIGVLNAEIHKSDNKLTNTELWEMFVKQRAPEFNIKLMRKDLSTILYPHDSSSQVGEPYCMAASMYPFLLSGLEKLGGKSAVPKNLDSFCGIYVNLNFALASEIKGAVATPEFIMYMDYFCRKEWGDSYYLKPGVRVTTDYCVKQKTIGSQIDQYFQQVTYSINQIASARGMQSPFTNFSFFDQYFFEGMFGEFVFPDGTRPQWESTNWLQKRYLRWLNNERLKCILTFPVCSYACLVDDKGNFKDKETFNFICKEYANGNSFFIYLSKSVDSLSSCCFSKDTKFLWKSSTVGVQLTTFEEFTKLPYKGYKDNFRVFHNGSWVDGKVITLPNRPMYKVTTYNNKEFIMTDNHINVTLHGEKTTEQLTTDDYLLFNTVRLNAIPENNEHLTYAQGYVIGSFLGDGSFGSEINGTIYDINLSQNEQKYKRSKFYWNLALKQMGLEQRMSLKEIINNVYPLRVSSKELAAFIIKWTNWFRGTYAYNKKLNMNALLQSVKFREGILQGWYDTDGGNSNRCYTTSSELAENMEALITSLGMQSIIDISDKTNEEVIIRGEEYKRDYPLYCVRWYEDANHRLNKDKDHSWVKFNNGIYFRIKSIEKYDYSDKVYCIECKNASEPYFTLPSGLITHNCRLQNAVSENTFNMTNGQIGVMTGSKNVITLDLNRIIQDWVRTWPDYTDHITEDGICDFPIEWITHTDFQNGIKEYLETILERVYLYQYSYNDLMHWCRDHHLYSAYDAGFISLDKQYLTIGINGLNQAAEFLGLTCNNNEYYKQFCKLIFSTIKEQNKLHKTKTAQFNTEQVPAESASVKLYNRDKADGYWIPNDTNLYASYIFKPNDTHISILDKIILHSSEFAADELDGGSACHLNLSEHLSKKQYEYLLKFMAKVGCKYATFNVPNSECDDCGFIAKQPFSKCPKCGSTKVSLWDRIIGYLSKISNWSTARQIENKTRSRKFESDINKELNEERTN